MSSYSTKLSENYLTALENGNYSDITIRVGKDDNIEEFAVHSFVLRTRSSYFQNALSEHKITGEKIILEEKNINPNVFKIILKYFYGGDFNLDSINFKNLLDILIAVNEFNINELINDSQDYLLNNMKQQLPQNLVIAYQISSKYDTCIKLKNFCLNIIKNSPELIFKSNDFNELNEEILILFFQSEFRMEEIEIWNAIIKWGIKQTPSITTTDTSLWRKENFRDLSNTLKRITPLIEYTKISSKDFYGYVKTYKKVFDKNFYDEILQYHLTQTIPQDSPLNKRKRINSELINLKDLALISSWIDKKSSIPPEYSKHPPYKLNLLLRGSKDGLTPKVFHQLCDNKGATITIVKDPDTDNILGGYNPLSWKSCNDINNADYTSKTNDAFVFSIDNLDMKKSILSRPIIQECIINYANSGPNFQVAFTFIHSEKYKCVCMNSKEFEKSIRQTGAEFCVKDYEVFQVLKL